ncbi:uncharacterized protein Hap1MRO34_016805 isoform 2-T2 [Clarias gariepinus]|uniref:uncharacterized protein LOC128540838 isoform X2 n=2 Tax=Clarias gariepinus TaxID=13013 RepID=UPI00234D0F07|nr:uncharacterized protein LOC128540838 isoform X2 [Clarias gariepinus]
MVHKKRSNTQEASEESLKKAKPSEGCEEAKLKDAADPEKPAETMDSVTGRHVAPTSPQKSDSETPVSRLPSHSPPSGVTGTCPMSFGETNVLETSLETCSPPVSESPEAAPTSVKKKDIAGSKRKKKKDSSTNNSGSKRKNEGDSSTDCSHREIKRAPPTTQENVTNQNNDVWVFLNIKNKNEVATIDISNKNILEYIKKNYIDNKKTKQEETLNTEKKEDFLQMIIKNTLIKNKFKELMDNKDRQQAIAIFKRTNNEIKVIGPIMSQRNERKHSEDLIIDEMNMFVKKNNDVSEIWIYTVNNQCYGRKKHTPCMYDLIQFSKAHEHINIYVGFSQYYVFIKKTCNFFKNLEDSAQKCKDVDQAGSETLEELQSTLRGEIKENYEEDLEKIKPANSQCTDENFNRGVVLGFLPVIEGLSILEFFKVDFEELLECLNFANEE